MEEQEEKNITEHLPKWLKSSRDIVLVLVTILSAVSTYYASVANHKIDSQGKLLEQNIKKREFDNAMRFKIFEEVKKAVGDDSLQNTELKQAVAIMIEEVLIEDSAFQEKMMRIMIKSPNINDTIKNQLKIKVFEQGESQLQSQLVSEKTKSIPLFSKNDFYRIDVFYLEDFPKESLRCATLIRDYLKKEYPNYDIRLRLLPKSKNEIPGYKIRENEIRHEDVENAFVEELLQKINNSKILESTDMKPKRITSKTPNYISIFIKNK